MMVHGLSLETLARLLSLDRPGGGDDSRRVFGAAEVLVEAPELEDEPMRWAAE